MARHYSIAWKLLFIQSKIGRAVDHELVEFLEAAFIEKKVDSLARGHLPGGLLLFKTDLAAAILGLA